MLVQVFDKVNSRYYKSLVYALLETETFHTPELPPLLCQKDEYAVVFDPYSNCFRLVPYLDYYIENIAGVPTKRFTEVYIIIQPHRTGWTVLSNEKLQNVNELYSACGLSGRITKMDGYPDVLGNTALLRALFNSGTIPRSGAEIPVRQPDDCGEWCHIAEQSDADSLLNTYDRFHDWVIDDIHYHESDDRAFIVTVAISAGNGRAVEFQFEGVDTLHLHTQIHCQRELFLLYISVTDNEIIWSVDDEPTALSGNTTYIRALSLKWKPI